MPSIINDLAGANYRQQIVPFSRFGTRKIIWFRVGHLDTNEGGLNMEAFNAVIDAIQTKGEIVTVGAPYVNNNYGKFIVGIFEDTFNNGNNTIGINNNSDNAGYNNMSETLQDAIYNVMEAGNYPMTYGGVQVQQIYMYGAPWQNTDGNDGWSDNSTYAEPDLKRDFLDGYLG